MYWSFALRLFAWSLVFPFVYAVVNLPLMGLAFLIVKATPQKGDRRLGASAWIVAAPMIVLGAVGQAFIFGAWAAFCAAATLVATSHPEVSHGWLYYVTGFSLCGSPLAYMAAKEGSMAAQDFSSPSVAGIVYKVGAQVAFITFCLSPGLMLRTYGWFLNWWYMG
jgi:hypothetical protein